MIELPDGSILLRKGEPIPAYCEACARFYPVPLHSERSECPGCGRVIIHRERPIQQINEPASPPDIRPIGFLPEPGFKELQRRVWEIVLGKMLLPPHRYGEKPDG